MNDLKGINNISASIENEIFLIQEIAKKLFPVLSEIAFIQNSLHIDLGLQVAESDYWAPTRYYADKINLHPSFGVKRYDGVRCDRDLQVLRHAMSELDLFFGKVIEKLSTIVIPTILVSGVDISAVILLAVTIFPSFFKDNFSLKRFPIRGVIL